MTAAIEAFLDHKRSQGRADLTIAAYRTRLETLLGEYLRRPIRAVASHGAQLYEAAQHDRSADTHRNLLVAGHLWARWCIKQRWLKSDPFAEVDPAGRRRHGADKMRLTVDESRKLEAWCLAHPDDQGAVLTLAYLYLGTRNSELVRRVVRDLDDDATLLVILKAKTPSGTRQLRIPELLGVLLRDMCAGRPADAPLFTGDRLPHMTVNAARNHVRRICAAAGVPSVPPQALRRTQASLATEAGETSLAVARHLGQATGEAPKVTTQSYIDRDSASAAQGDRVLRVIRGGRP